jgi:hypothetical protein
MGLAKTMQQSYLNGGLGVRVERPAAALGVQGTRAIFNINGQVEITLLVGYCVTVMASVGVADLQVLLIQAAGNINLGNAVCASQNIAAGSFLNFPDAIATTPIVWTASDLVPIATYTHVGQLRYIANTGTISITVGTADQTTGSVRWTCFYIPISRNGRVSAT